jgi:hypothetical protein
MKTPYTKGYEAGVEYARKQVLEFLNAHHDLGDILTLEEVIKEVEVWNTERGLNDGRLARHECMEECKGVCENCFGPDLCVVCEGA